VGFQNVVEL